MAGPRQSFRYVQNIHRLCSANKFQLGTDDGSVVATLVMFGVLTVAFFVCEHFQGPYAMIPLRLLKPRIIWLQALYAWL